MDQDIKFPFVWLELRRKGQRRGMLFTCHNMHSREEFEERAAIIARRCTDRIYGYEFIIIRHWEKLFANEPINEFLKF